MTRPDLLETAVLGRILLLQSALQAAPDDNRLAAMVVRGLEKLPGVTGCVVCVEGNLHGLDAGGAENVWACPNRPVDAEGGFSGCTDDCPSKSRRGRPYRFGLQTSRRTYGGLFLEIEDETAFAPYSPFVDNTANLAALHIENAGNAKALEQANRGLESQLLELTAEIQESEVRYRLLFEKAPLGYQSLDETGCFIEVNQVWLETLGYSREEVIGKSFGDFLHPEWKDHFKENFPRFKAVGEILGVEFEMIKKDGSIVLVSFNGRIGTDKNGRFKQTHCILRDITQQRQAEEALRESESNLSAVLNASPESAFLIDCTGRVITCNTVATQRLGRQPEDVVGHSIYGILPDEVAAARRSHVEEVSRTCQSLQFDDWRSGRFFSNYLFPVLEPDGKVSRIAVFAHDITEHRKTEENLKRQNELLAAIRHAQDVFISEKDYRQAYQEILHALVEKTGSEFGFLDEVLYEPDGTPYKMSLALSDISWDDASRYLYEQLVAQKLEFRNLNNLSGAPVLECRIIIANDVPRHPWYRGLPKGHPRLITYLGIPLYFGSDIIGVVGVANRDGGYTGEMAEFIKPLIQACSAMIWSGRVARREKEGVVALKTSEEKYRQIAETANEGIWAMDVQHRTTYVNRRMAEMLGYAPDEMLGRSVESFMLPEDLCDHEAKMSRRESGGGGIYERRFRHRDGSEVWTIVSATALLDPEGRFAGSFAMFTDITDRKRAEEALREERDRMQRYLDTTDALIVALDESGTVTMMNRYGLGLLGYTEEQIVGKNWFDVALPQPDGMETVYPVFQEVMRGNIAQARYFENDVITASGERRTIAWSNTYLCDAGGKRIGALSAGLDITEQKRAEEQVRQLQKTESLGRMAGAIAHHFNNKLGVVMGNLEMALEDLPGDSPVREQIAQAMEGARRSSEVSRMMLTYLGQMTGHRDPMDLSDTLGRTLPMLQAAVPRHVLLTTDLTLPGPVVAANAGEMQQVLSNLVVNAWESMGDAEGEVHVSVRTVAGSEISQSHRFPVDWVPKNGDYACLEVRDSGCGIAEADMERLFDPFYSTKFTGRGLGLPAALGIVRAHGGCIAVESRVGTRDTERGTEKSVEGVAGSGTVFRVFIPVTGKEIARRPEKTFRLTEMTAGAPPISEGGKESGTVLLIEDDPQLLQASARMLELMGFTVLKAGDGVEGLDIFKERRGEIRFVICDLTMPRMGGWEALAAMRKLRPDIPVILASGYDESTVMKGDHAEWPQAFLGKPYSSKDLRKVIGKVTAGD